jgi:monoamine oxidase
MRRRSPSVIVAGAGLAGLAASRYLEQLGAHVTLVEARDRVGGRVHTLRGGFFRGQHAEAGADLIEEEQDAVLKLAAELRLEPVRILRSGWGFHGTSTRGAKTARGAQDTFQRAAERLEPEIRAYKAAESRWGSGIAREIARETVAAWLARIRADAALRAGVRGLRGFFLADPDVLSLLALVDQFASGSTPGEGRMYRLRDATTRFRRRWRAS